MSLSITAIIPVLNCRDAFARHLTSVEAWQSKVSEIIIVDSGSTDGTRELAEKFVRDSGAGMISTPPGLYGSWNAGIARASHKFCYISTVEDPITAEGLMHLHEVMIQSASDMVISPPRIMSGDGSMELDWKMPINHAAERLESTGENVRTLSTAESVLLFCGCIPGGLLGSSASNLYRTEFLKRNPFPEVYGRAGDTAFGISVCSKAKVTITTKKCACFYAQTSHTEETPSLRLERYEKLSRLVRDQLSENRDAFKESAMLIAWFNSHDDVQRSLLDWLVRENKYKILLEEFKEKYQCGFWKFLEITLREKAYRIMHGKK